MSTSGKGASPKSVPITAELADELLRRLSNSDEFREQFKRAPLDAVRSLGPVADADAAGLLAPFGGCRVEQLASKESIAAAHAELRAALTQGLAYTSPQLEASNLDRRDRS